MTEEQEKLTTSYTEVCVVKRCLIQALSPRLDVAQKLALLDYIDECTDIASRIARRTSLAFLYFVVRRLELNIGIPDFGKATDGYWLSWMRLGLEEFGDDKKKTKVYPTLVPKAKYSDSVLQDAESKNADKTIFTEIEVLLGTTISPGVRRAVPKYFDRIIGHLAMHRGREAVENAMTVNFFAKMKRVCKYEVAVSGASDFGAYDLLKAVCNTNVVKVTPCQLRPFVDELRETMGLSGNPDFSVDEITQFDFPTRFAVHWFLQQRLAVFGKRKLMMSPVHKVQRMHIRLDATHLSLVMNDINMAPVSAKLKALYPGSPPPCPRDKEYPDVKAFRTAKAEYMVAKATYVAALAHYRTVKSSAPMSFFSTLEVPENPEKVLNAEIPVPSFKIPEGMSKKDPTWMSEKKERQRLVDESRRARSERRATLEFRASLRKYEDYESCVQEFGLGLFGYFKDRNPKLGWKPSGSIMTDGVSLCVTYERRVAKVNKTCQEAEDEFAEKLNSKKKASKLATELDPCDDYDPDASTCIGDRLIIGLDPGRVSIVTMICVDLDGKRTCWRLSRGQFHTESGILDQNKLQSKRYKSLVGDFASLTIGGGALRASSTAEIRTYIEAYKKFEDRWFVDFALKLVESRARMKRFIGKTKTLASFFSKVRKEAEVIRERCNMSCIEVAYGHCGPTMAASGKGQLGVPTTGAYRAFTRERFFDPKSGNVVSTEDERFTSKMSWETGKEYRKVYKTHDASGKEFLRYTARKSSPFVAPCDFDAVSKRKDEIKLKAKIRRGGGTSASEPRALNTWVDANDAHELRHIEVRGLLFCQETCMFFDRDERSARAIAGLRCIKLAGFGRPSAFRQKDKKTPGGTQSLEVVFEGAQEYSEKMRPAEGLINKIEKACTPPMAKELFTGIESL